MRTHRPSRSLLAAIVPCVLLAACGDSPTEPSEAERTAQQLAELAESMSGGSGLPASNALFMASSAVRAGAPLRTITVRVDGANESWTALSVRMSLSEQACAQLLDEVELPGASHLCAPLQYTVAWHGSPAEPARLLTVSGDTGAVSIGFDGDFTGEFGADLGRFGFSILHELATESTWWADSGGMSSAESAVDGECPRRFARGEAAADVSCNVARFTLALGGRYRGFDFGPLMPGPGTPLVPGAGSPPDAQPDPLPTRRIEIAGQSIGGMHIRILRFPDGTMPDLRRRAFGATRATATVAAALSLAAR